MATMVSKLYWQPWSANSTGKHDQPALLHKAVSQSTGYKANTRKEGTENSSAHSFDTLNMIIHDVISSALSLSSWLELFELAACLNMANAVRRTLAPAPSTEFVGSDVVRQTTRYSQPSLHSFMTYL